jgi:hypothetical protein
MNVKLCLDVYLIHYLQVVSREAWSNLYMVITSTEIKETKSSVIPQYAANAFAT